MKTKYMILAVTLLLAPTAMAQDYFAKLRFTTPTTQASMGKRRANSQSINSNYQSQKPDTSTA